MKSIAIVSTLLSGFVSDVCATDDTVILPPLVQYAQKKLSPQERYIIKETNTFDLFFDSRMLKKDKKLRKGSNKKPSPSDESKKTSPQKIPNGGILEPLAKEQLPNSKKYAVEDH